MCAAQSLIAGRYVLRQRIGAGGMGRVWRAFDQVLLREVAIKEFAPRQDLTADQIDRVRAMMIREAQAAAQICHPNVVRIYDILHSGQGLWIVMEHVASRSLQQIIRTDGPMTPQYTATIGLALLDALSAAHDAGVLHRDVTPQNVLLARDGRIMLTDFGVALLGTAGQNTEPELVGTVRYTAPERVAQGLSTPAGDLWSLGATMYAAVEGRAPYDHPSVMDTLAALLAGPPDPPRRAGGLSPILNGMLAHEPSERWTPTLVRAGLQRLLDQSAAGNVPSAVGRYTPSADVLVAAAA